MGEVIRHDGEKQYEPSEFEVILFEGEDIITTSTDTETSKH